MTGKDALILPFSQIRAGDLPLVGGKGANLGEMTQAGFPVPPGFCLTTAAFQQFIAACPDSVSPYALLDTVNSEDVETVRTAGQRVRQLLLEVPMPADIAAAVKRAWHAAGTDEAYAVRSSATAEDLPEASFAGQQDTYLNVRGEADLLDAIRRCWVSLFTDRAILYRLQNSFPHRDVQLSVVIQKMIPAEKAGTLFTADPLTSHRHTLAIDASFGLGEALVGGLVSPDSYRVDKRARTILSRQIAKKQLAIFLKKGGGTRRETLGPDQQEKIVLTDAQILDLAEMGCQIEAHYGRPQDIEWAIADGQTYLLQTRPITSLYPIDGLTSPDDSLHVFFSMGHQQSMTRAMSPLSLSSIQLLMPIGHAESRFDNAYIRVSGGRLFVDLTLPLRHPLFGRAMLGLLSQLDALAPAAVKQAIQRPDFKRAHGLRLSFSSFRGLAKILRRVFSALWRRDLTGIVARTNALMDRYVDDLRRALQGKPAGRAQLQVIMDTLPGLFPYFLNWVPEAGAGIAATRLLPRLARHWLSPDEGEALTLGIPGNVVNEMNLAIGDLADVARQSPDLVAWFEHLNADGDIWLAQAARLDGSAPFMAAWENFIARYGMRGAAEIDIMMPRWHEDPLPVLRVIAGHIHKAVHSRAQFETLVRAREAAFSHLLKAAGRGPFGRLRTRLFRRLYHVMTEAGGMREHHKLLAIRVLAVVKEIVKESAAHLVAEGKLTEHGDVWYLTWEELFAIWDDEATDWGAHITQRRAGLDRYQKLAPPLIITSDGETPVVRYHIEDAPPGALAGNPVSAGVVEGTVHVIHDPQTETISPGEILVAVFTDPGWTPLFINAGGLVMEIGGPLTHGAVVAREYGIPAVVGVREATKRLQNGQRVRVDGNRGIIEIH